MLRACLFISFLFACLCYGESKERRIQGMLRVGAIDEATHLAHEWYHSEPSLDSTQTYILTLARQGRSQEALSVLGASGLNQNESLLEEIAWAVLEQAAHSSSLPVRLYALIGAATVRDARGVALLELGLSDRNARVRGLAIELSGAYPDAVLNHILVEQSRLPQSTALRCTLARALGRQGSELSRQALMALLQKENLEPSIRGAVAQALCEMAETPTALQLRDFASSPSSGLRLLACRWAALCGTTELQSILQQRTKDPLPDVRVAAIEALTLHSEDSLDPQIFELALRDINPRVRMAAACGLLLHGFKKGEDYLLSQISTGNAHDHRLLAAALAHSGSAGVGLTRSALKTVKDPAARLNLLIALLSQNTEEALAVKEIASLLESSREHLLWRDDGSLFAGVYPQDGILLGPGQAIAEDQLLRLRLLSLMAYRAPALAVPAIEAQLTSRHWQVAGFAAYQVLTEGSLEHVDGLVQRLENAEPHLRVQLALLLAVLGKDPVARQVLEEAYPDSGRLLKERILEGLGAVADKQSLPLLLAAMREPYENLRIIAASAVIQCLSH